MAKVTNISGRPLAENEVYVGGRVAYNRRPDLIPSKFRNKRKPARNAPMAVRMASIEAYEQRLRSNPALCEALDELEGKDLACWCAPLPCHADVLIKLLEEKKGAGHEQA